jgi:predicted CXXCH cytochrome family protein
MPRQRWLTAAIVLLLSAGAATLPFIIAGASTARGRALSHIEQAVAEWLLTRSVSRDARSARNPLAGDESEVMAGQKLYSEHCEICHAHDGSGHTLIGSAQYPPASELGLAAQRLTDGEIFYHIQHGIRNTGMPGFGLPERQIWQLVSFVRHLPKVAAFESTVASALASEPHTQVADPGADASRLPYVGSIACKRCHEEIYARWKNTRMANVVREPGAAPHVIIPDLTKPDPLVTFSEQDIALVYGSRWKQRYFKRMGDDYFPLPAQWDVQKAVWKPYNVKVGTDWWTAHYGRENTDRPTGPLCDGCHSVNYDIATKKVVEWNVGCERCHGPSRAHVERAGKGGTFNPARADLVEANDVCIQCHSQGRPLVTPINGVYYDWPVGFHVGQNRLSEFWRLEEHKAGETSFTHFADGTAHKNRMQGNDFTQSQMYKHGVTCFSCHDVHGTKQTADLWQRPQALCLDCHAPTSPNGPRAPSLEAHTHHAANSPGNACIACHMPAIEETIGKVNVRSHTFRFITPAQSEALKVPNACVVCHTDKSNEWAATSLAGWNTVSPWRMQAD